jgi:mono/diheme cytochrome c family protein
MQKGGPRMTRAARLLIAAGLITLAVAYGFTRFDVYSFFRGDGRLTSSRLANAANGKILYDAGGCVSCHASASVEDRIHLGGGKPLKTPFGIFYPPNISPDPQDGIGRWTEAQFIRAIREGTAPDGSPYYPAFPYTSYRHMSPDDAADLFAYLLTLPPVSGKAPAHALHFPFSIRPGLVLWKLAFLDGTVIEAASNTSESWNRGRYLVEGVGHCGECHSPRNFAGAIIDSKRLSGGPNLDGKGFVPNLTPDKTGLAQWSEAEIASLLKDGFTPDYDSVGGSMAEVVRNTAELSDTDRMAMAGYLKSLPPMTGQVRSK